jgi:hypothetical protein
MQLYSSSILQTGAFLTNLLDSHLLLTALLFLKSFSLRSPRDRLGEAKAELDRIMTAEQLSAVPVVILGNKIDLQVMIIKCCRCCCSQLQPSCLCPPSHSSPRAFLFALFRAFLLSAHLTFDL